MTLTFKDFILSEVKYDKVSRAKSLTLSTEEIIKSIEQYSPKTIEMLMHTRIYRGVPGVNVDPKYVDPTRFVRKSASTSNFYTTLIDNLPSWSKYPKRSQSLVCTNDNQYAGGYGKTYLVIPMDGVPIGVCSEDDFWGSFPNVHSNLGRKSMAEFNDHIEKILNALDIVVGLETKPWVLASSSDFNKLKKELNKLTKSNIDKVFNQLSRHAFSDEFDDYIRKNIKSMSMVDVLNKLLDPDKNDFSLIKSGEKIPPASGEQGQEIWVGGKSLLLPINDSPDSNNVFKHFGLLSKIDRDLRP